MFTDAPGRLSSIAGNFIPSSPLDLAGRLSVSARSQTLLQQLHQVSSKYGAVLSNLSLLNSTSTVYGGGGGSSSFSENFSDLRGSIINYFQQDSSNPLQSSGWIAFIRDRSGREVIPWQCIQGLQTPALQFETKPIFRGGKMRHFASSFSADDMSMSFTTPRSGVVTDGLAYWIREVQDKDGFYRLPGEYKRDIAIYLLDAKNYRVTEWYCEGCWVKSWDAYTLDAQSNLLTTQVQISVDDVFFEVTDPLL